MCRRPFDNVQSLGTEVPKSWYQFPVCGQVLNTRMLNGVSGNNSNLRRVHKIIREQGAMEAMVTHKLEQWRT